MENPLLEIDALPAFDRIAAAHARPALERVLADNRARLAELTAQPAADVRLAGGSRRGAQLPLEPRVESDRPLERRGQLRGDARGLQRMRAAAHRLLLGARPERGAVRGATRTCSETEGASLDPAQRKLLENSLRDFRLAGVDLPPDRKTRYREVVQRLAQLATKFSENVLDAARAYHPARHRRGRARRACRRTRSIARRKARVSRDAAAGCSSSISRPT